MPLRFLDSSGVTLRNCMDIFPAGKCLKSTWKLVQLTLHQFVFSPFSWRGVRTGVPKMYHYGMWIIWGWRQLRPCRLTKNFYLSLGEFKLRPCTIRVITRNNFLWPIYRARQTLIIPLIILQRPSFLLSPYQCTFSLAQNVMCASFALSVPGSLMFVGVSDYARISRHKYVIKFGHFLLLLRLVCIWLLDHLEEPRRVEECLFLSYTLCSCLCSDHPLRHLLPVLVVLCHFLPCDLA